MGLMTVLLLALSGPLSTQEAQPAPGTSLHAEREVLLDQVEGLLEQENFAELERIAGDLRRTKARFSNGGWKIESFYAGVKNGRGHVTLQSQPRYFATLERWRAAQPESVTPRIALANAYKTLAWDARGTGYAYTVTKDGKDAFGDNLGEAWTLLVEAEALKAGDPFCYQLLVDVGKALGQPKAEVNAAFTKGMKLEGGYGPLYTTMARYLLPRWGGPERAVAAFAAKVSDETAGREGDVLYARIAWSIFRDTGEEEFDKQLFDWPRIASGYALLEQRFPGSALNRNILCRLACHFAEKKRASELFGQLGERWSEDEEAAWDTPAARSEWREWATGKTEHAGAVTLQRAASEDDVPLLRQLLASGADVDARDPEGKTALLNAILHHNTDATAFLLGAGADPSLGTRKGWTPLHEAVDNMDAALVRALLERGASPNVASDDSKWTPLHLAAQRGFSGIVKLLLESEELDLDARLRNGDSALNQAIRKGHADVVALLVKKAGVRLDLPQDANGWLPIHYAAHFGNTEILALLLDAGAGVHSRTTKGHTPMQVAGNNQGTAAIALLRSRGARE